MQDAEVTKSLEHWCFQYDLYKEDFTDHVCWFFAREKMLHLGNDPTIGRPLNSQVKTFLIYTPNSGKFFRKV